jgi:hypothetical protein
VRISDVLYWVNESTKKCLTHAQGDSGAIPLSDDLTKLVTACTKEGRLKPWLGRVFHNLQGGKLSVFLGGKP